MKELDMDKVRKLPQDKRVEFFDNMVKLTDLHHRQGNLMDELRRSLIHEWEVKMEQVEVNSKTFKSLVSGYYDAVESGAAQFKWQGRDLLVGYAKYLVEYMAAEVAKREQREGIMEWHSATRFLKDRRRKHQQWKDAQNV